MTALQRGVRTFQLQVWIRCSPPRETADWKSNSRIEVARKRALANDRNGCTAEVGHKNFHCGFGANEPHRNCWYQVRAGQHVPEHVRAKDCMVAYSLPSIYRRNSDSVLRPLLRLHLWHAKARLLLLFVPPRTTGVLCSMCISSG